MRLSAHRQAKAGPFTQSRPRHCVPVPCQVPARIQPRGSTHLRHSPHGHRAHLKPHHHRLAHVRARVEEAAVLTIDELSAAEDPMLRATSLCRLSQRNDPANSSAASLGAPHRLQQFERESRTDGESPDGAPRRDVPKSTAARMDRARTTPIRAAAQHPTAESMDQRHQETIQRPAIYMVRTVPLPIAITKTDDRIVAQPTRIQ